MLKESAEGAELAFAMDAPEGLRVRVPGTTSSIIPVLEDLNPVFVDVSMGIVALCENLIQPRLPDRAAILEMDEFCEFCGKRPVVTADVTWNVPLTVRQ